MEENVRAKAQKFENSTSGQENHSWEGRSIGCLRQKAGVETAGMGRAKS